jgi:hypothetical protein
LVAAVIKPALRVFCTFQSTDAIKQIPALYNYSHGIRKQYTRFFPLFSYIHLYKIIIRVT